MQCGTPGQWALACGTCVYTCMDVFACAGACTFVVCTCVGAHVCMVCAHVFTSGTHVCGVHMHVHVCRSLCVFGMCTCACVHIRV